MAAASAADVPDTQPSTTAEDEPAQALPRPPARRLSVRARVAASALLPACVLLFVVALGGTWLQTERGAASALARTRLGSAYVRAVTAIPLLSTLCFQGSALAAVLLASRLSEHKRAPPPSPPQPRSRQERRRWQQEARKMLDKRMRNDRRDLVERVKAAGGKVVRVGAGA